MLTELRPIAQMPFSDRGRHQNLIDQETNEISEALDRNMIPCLSFETKLGFDLLAKAPWRHRRDALPVTHSQSEQVVHITSHICI